MALTFFCAKCGKRFDLDESMAGRKARCKQCQHVFVISGGAGTGRASTAMPHPRPSAARAAGPTPSRPADDPYGFDERPPLSPARTAYAIPGPDEESLPPRLGKPVAPVPRKPKTRGEGEFAWLGPITVYGLATEVLLALLVGAFALAKLNSAAAVTIGLLVLVCFGMIAIGSVMNIVVPFLESATQGLLCFFVPFYNLYYLITRWETMRRPFYLTLSGVALPVAAGLLLPAIAASRQAALRAQQGMVAGPDAGAQPAAPRAVPAPAAGDSLEVNVSGVNDRRMGQRIVQEMLAITRELSPNGCRSQVSHHEDRWTFRLSPVPDPQAFADKITFGTVSLNDRTIDVVANPDLPVLNDDAGPNGPETDQPSDAVDAPPPTPRPGPNRPRFGGPRGPRRLPSRRPFRP